MRGRTVLDVGCGSGEDLMHPVFAEAVARWGIDPDERAIELGRKAFPGISLIHGFAESLPFDDAHFDVVMARVSLPYTNIPVALAEIARVMKPGGHLFVTLHYWCLHAKWLANACRTGAWKRAVDLVFVTLASAWYALTGVVLRKPWGGGRETVQCAFRIKQQLSSAGFRAIESRRNGRDWIVTAIQGGEQPFTR